MEENFELLNIPDYTSLTSLMYPKENTILYDRDGSIDSAKHPLIFCAKNDEYTCFYGFRVTSHPCRDDSLRDYFYVSLSKDDIEYKNYFKMKSVSYVSCEDIYVFEGFVYKYFLNNGNIKNKAYLEKFTEVIVKHILLQEFGLSKYNENTDIFLNLIGYKREDIINLKMYKIFYKKFIDSSNKQIVQNDINLQRNKILGNKKTIK